LSQLAFDELKIGEALGLLAGLSRSYRQINQRFELCNALLSLGECQAFVGFKRDAQANIRMALWMAEEHQLFALVCEARWLLILHELSGGQQIDAGLHLQALIKVAKNEGLASWLELADTLALLLDESRAAFVGALAQRLGDGANTAVEMKQRYHLLMAMFAKPGEDGYVAVCQALLNDELKLPRLWFVLGHAVLKSQASFDGRESCISKFGALTKQIDSGLDHQMRETFRRQWDTKLLLEPIAATDKPITSKAVEQVDDDQLHFLSGWSEFVEQLHSDSKFGKMAKLCFEYLSSNIDGCLRFSVVASRLVGSSLRDHLPIEISVPIAIPEDYEVSLFDRGRSVKATMARNDLTLRFTFAQMQQSKKSLAVSLPSADENEEASNYAAGRAYPIFKYATLSGFIYVECAGSSLQSGSLTALLEAVAVQIGLWLASSSSNASQVAIENSVLAGSASQGYGGIVAKSNGMAALVKQIAKLESSLSSTLIEGESGVGKELVVRALHANSKRCEQPLVIVDCASLSKELFEARFFGFVKGAFTGAHQDRQGFFSAADGGTLFLDNVDQLASESQAKLLRALQEGEVRPLGQMQPIKVDVRIVAATSKNLLTLAQDGKFREDLFYRLDVIHLIVPPLRQRRKDIQPLVSQFLNELTGTTKYFEFEADAKQALLDYVWPGNVRQLRNEIERLVAAYPQSSTILRPQLNGRILETAGAIVPLAEKLTKRSEEVGLNDMLRSIEKNIIEHELKKNSGNITKTAKALSLARYSLQMKMKKLGL
jgi:DNA-binding NtrC family response regulator